MKTTRLFAALAAVACLQAGIAGAQSAPRESLVGRWAGTVDSQDGSRVVQLGIDSSATGWHGQALAPDLGGDPISFSAISVKPDTISLTMPVQGVDIVFFGWINPDTHAFEGQVYYENTDAGTFSFKRVPPSSLEQRRRSW